MRTANIKTEILAMNIAGAIEQFDISQNDKVFDSILQEMKSQYPELKDEQRFQLLALCVEVYRKASGDEVELVMTAPDTFRLKNRRIHDAVKELLTQATASILMTDYSASDYFSEMLDLLIRKSQQGVYVQLYVNNLDKQKEVLDRLLAYQSQFMKVFQYNRDTKDKMAALHAKVIVTDGMKSMISSANLSYHGMKGNVEMGFLVSSKEKAKEITELFSNLRHMKVFTDIRYLDE
jgi:phosphatidylserine/phosphatidylglycerophosphate/cardiolipin synthase-like enzyme